MHEVANRLTLYSGINFWKRSKVLEDLSMSHYCCHVHRLKVILR